MLNRLIKLKEMWSWGGNYWSEDIFLSLGAIFTRLFRCACGCTPFSLCDLQGKRKLDRCESKLFSCLSFFLYLRLRVWIPTSVHFYTRRLWHVHLQRIAILHLCTWFCNTRMTKYRYQSSVTASRVDHFLNGALYIFWVISSPLPPCDVYLSGGKENPQVCWLGLTGLPWIPAWNYLAHCEKVYTAKWKLTRLQNSPVFLKYVNIAIPSRLYKVEGTFVSKSRWDSLFVNGVYLILRGFFLSNF